MQRSGADGFVISSLCHSGGCVGVAADDDVVRVRSTLCPDGPVVTFTREEWSVFLAGVRSGEFDFPDLVGISG